MRKVFVPNLPRRFVVELQLLSLKWNKDQRRQKKDKGKTKNSKLHLRIPFQETLN
jgi:hypothetical protein